MRHLCSECNAKTEMKAGSRINLRCNECGGKSVILDESVTLKCDLCRPCKEPEIQQKTIKADEIFNITNECFFATIQGQNATWVVIPKKIRIPKIAKSKSIKKLKSKIVKRKTTEKKPE